jgi:hypothetical protein
VVHRRAASSDAGECCPAKSHTTKQDHVGARTLASSCKAGRDQKIVHVRIVLGATLE